jgi:hypothetical protein
MEGKMENGQSLTRLLHNLIREHGQYKDQSYYVDVNSFPLSDKRLLLAYFEGAEWLEYAYESEIKTDALFSDHSKFIQKSIDDDCDELYREDMEEMRSYR